MWNIRVIRLYGILFNLVSVMLTVVISLAFFKASTWLFDIAKSQNQATSNHPFEQITLTFASAEVLFWFSLFIAVGVLMKMYISYTRTLYLMPKIDKIQGYRRKDYYEDEVVTVKQGSSFDGAGALLGYMVLGIFGALLFSSKSKTVQQRTGKKIYLYTEFIFTGIDGKSNRFLVDSLYGAGNVERKLKDWKGINI